MQPKQLYDGRLVIYEKFEGYESRTPQMLLSIPPAKPADTIEISKCVLESRFAAPLGQDDGTGE